MQKCLKIKPLLSEESRKLIEEDVTKYLNLNPRKNLMMQERMLISKLNAKTHGRNTIEFEDYTIAKVLLESKA